MAQRPRGIHKIPVLRTVHGFTECKDLSDIRTLFARIDIKTLHKAAFKDSEQGVFIKKIVIIG